MHSIHYLLSNSSAEAPGQSPTPPQRLPRQPHSSPAGFHFCPNPMLPAMSAETLHSMSPRSNTAALLLQALTLLLKWKVLQLQHPSIMPPHSSAAALCSFSGPPASGAHAPAVGAAALAADSRGARTVTVSEIRQGEHTWQQMVQKVAYDMAHICRQLHTCAGMLSRADTSTPNFAKARQLCLYRHALVHMCIHFEIIASLLLELHAWFRTLHNTSPYQLIREPSCLHSKKASMSSPGDAKFQNL